nr:MAG TPA: hypothetical protein [Caudoviricetes sp.]
MSAVVIFVWAVFNWPHSKRAFLGPCRIVRRRCKFTCYVRRPNITGTLNPVCQDVNATAPSGAFSRTTGGGMTGYEFARMKTNFVFDASDSSSTYGSASTVQPSALRSLLCIKI